MPLDTCIANIGEYYSSHYLDSTFARDVKEQVARWREQGSAAPPRRLQSLSSHYFRAKTQALDEDAPAARSGAELTGWHAHLLEALGYTGLDAVPVGVEGNKAHIPVLGRINRYNKPWLVVTEAPFCLPDSSLKDGMPSEDPLEMGAKDRAPAEDETRALCAGNWSRLIGRLILSEDAPRWVLLLAGSQVVLIDTRTFAQGRYLAFDLDDAFGRGIKGAFDHIAAFLSAETLCPQGETDDLLHDRLEAQSHKFAHGVTDALQLAVREAIEILANEWVADRRRRKLSYRQVDDASSETGKRDVTAEDLRHEALVFVYRIIFCLYAEARGAELGILPIIDDAYRLGYSLESLRDLEQVPLTPTSEEGTYFHQHLHQLFLLIQKGFHPDQANDAKQSEFDYGKTVKTFTIRPLTATLFDPASTPLLDGASLRNICLQQVIQRLSLSVDEKTRTIGRVNYAELGINQLGAVYEGLLSYKGMFAREDLIQVKPKGKELTDKKTPTWFVPVARADEFGKDEVERLPGGQPRIYKEGTFILHLSGIDRQQSASYYTPEVLTKCLVEEALRELLRDFEPKDADRVLDLKVCEPAMGSASFLEEVGNQLATHYLDLKQKQLDRNIEPGRYQEEHRRAKHYITTRNLYGVDLNATAVELGALTLWLGSVHQLSEEGVRDEGLGVSKNPTNEELSTTNTAAPIPCATPWFGLRLRAGNSLIGARRAVWTKQELQKGKHRGKDAKPPRLIKPGEDRKKGEIYHFLVFDSDMVPTHKDKLMKTFWADECEVAKAWHKKHVQAKWDKEDVVTAERVCDAIDRHWGRYAMRRSDALKKTATPASVWPQPLSLGQVPSSEGCPEGGVGSPVTFPKTDFFKGTVQGEMILDQAVSQKEETESGLDYRERIKAELESESGSFQRIRHVMDLWCALWFWPLESVDALPTRRAFLAVSELMLEEQQELPLHTAMMSIALGFDVDAFIKTCGNRVPDASQLSEVFSALGISNAIAEQQHFHHWELAYPEVLGSTTKAAGFDLIVGNPPWLKVSWDDAVVLSELDPILGVRESKSAVYNRVRLPMLQGDEHEENRTTYREELTGSAGSVSFLNAHSTYPELLKIQTNLYKNFIVRSWALLGQSGIAGLLHPEGPYDDAKGGSLRARMYRRLRAHYQFENELTLFVGTNDHGRLKFSINLYGGERERVEFRHMSNLYHPITVEQSQSHADTHAPVPGMKTDEGKWDTRPHCRRIVTVTEQELSLFSKLLEESGVAPQETRLPQLHAQTLVPVIEKLASASKRLGDQSGEYLATEMFHEANAQRDDIITRQDSPSYQPKTTGEWVLSGPHVFVGNPLNKEPRSECTANSHYDDIDLTAIPADYQPRAVYRPGNENGDRTAFYNAIDEWPKPSLPGFWPVSDETDIDNWRILFGEEPGIHGLDPSTAGAHTARQFVCLSKASGNLPKILTWMRANPTVTDPETVRGEVGKFTVRQARPAETDISYLPRPITSHYRYVNRRRCPIATERSLAPSIAPPGPAHIDGIFSIAAYSATWLVAFCAANSSVVVDFLIKVMGKADARHDVVSMMPIVGVDDTRLLARGLRLNCVTTAYADLWKEVADASILDDRWTTDDPRLCHEFEHPWAELNPNEWDWKTPLRSDFVRRQALLEIDVLVAQSLNLTLEELLTIYRVQFPVMRQYEAVDEYDSRGRRLPNTARKDAGGKELREARLDHDGALPLTITYPINNNTETLTKTFYPPFTLVDREAEYTTAWAVFESRAANADNIAIEREILPWIVSILHAKGGPLMEQELQTVALLLHHHSILERLVHDTVDLSALPTMHQLSRFHSLLDRVDGQALRVEHTDSGQRIHLGPSAISRDELERVPDQAAALHAAEIGIKAAAALQQLNFDSETRRLFIQTWEEEVKYA